MVEVDCDWAARHASGVGVSDRKGPSNGTIACAGSDNLLNFGDSLDLDVQLVSTADGWLVRDEVGPESAILVALENFLAGPRRSKVPRGERNHGGGEGGGLVFIDGVSLAFDHNLVASVQAVPQVGGHGGYAPRLVSNRGSCNAGRRLYIRNVAVVAAGPANFLDGGAVGEGIVGASCKSPIGGSRQGDDEIRSVGPAVEAVVAVRILGLNGESAIVRGYARRQASASCGRGRVDGTGNEGDGKGRTGIR